MKSLNGNIWKHLPIDNKKAELISQRFNLPLIVSEILTLRGIEAEDTANFIEPKIQNLLPNPNVLKDVNKAAQKIAEFIIKGKKIAIIGDYDVDGATSSALLRLFFEATGLEVLVHIPDRDEGYGPSKQAVDKFKSQGFELIITVDCGTTAFEVFDYAKEQGLEVIVLDHHEAEVKLPNVYALVNPKRLDEENDIEYLKYLAAVGVVFLTVVAINRELREQGFYQNKQEPNLMNYLDLVALGTVCDVVPLLGLNRAFVRQGLKIMANRQNQGLKALIDKANITEAPTAFHLGFVLGPRINAGGRVGDSSIGNKLLCAQTELEAKMLADKLDTFNTERKDIEAYVMLSAIEMLESSPQKYPIAFVFGKDWHQGVIGIVAGKLKERYNLPSFVMSIEADEVKGSARSVKGIDLGALIISAKEKGIITKGGGHTMAAGFSLKEENMETFQKFIGEYVKNKLGEEEIAPVVEIDAAITLSAANVELAEKLEMLEPYGANNPEPKLMIERVKIKNPRIIGSGHVSCMLSSIGGGSVKAIAFRVADTELGNSLLNSNQDSFNIIGTLRKDNWQGRNSTQFIIEDILPLP